MGHYDDCYEEEDKRLAKLRKEHRERIHANVVKALREMGPANVITDILMDLESFKRRMDR